VEAAALVLKALSAENRYSGLAVFGSVARHEAREESDIDLVVAAPEATSSLDILRFKQLAETVLGRELDLVSSYRSQASLLCQGSDDAGPWSHEEIVTGLREQLLSRPADDVRSGAARLVLEELGQRPRPRRRPWLCVVAITRRRAVAPEPARRQQERCPR
jgi:predicted nucleotidyltransferase